MALVISCMMVGLHVTSAKKFERPATSTLASVSSDSRPTRAGARVPAPRARSSPGTA